MVSARCYWGGQARPAPLPDPHAGGLAVGSAGAPHTPGCHLDPEPTPIQACPHGKQLAAEHGECLVAAASRLQASAHSQRRRGQPTYFNRFVSPLRGWGGYIPEFSPQPKLVFRRFSDSKDFSFLAG